MTRRGRVVFGVVIAAVVAVVATRVWWEGRSALARGDEAATAGDPDAAIRHWQRAARWYLPGAGHVETAYDHLRELARTAQRSGDSSHALAAWRAIRRSVLATRSVYVPYSERLEEANQHIAELMASIEDPSVDPGASQDDRREFHLRLLQRRVGPSVGWSLVALFGLAMWIGGALLLAWRGIDERDRFVRGPVTVSGLLIVVGLFTWLLGLAQA